MELVKASARQQVQVPQASKQADQHAKTEAKPDTAAAKNAEAQTRARATTNTRGEKMGQLVNVKA